MNQDPTGRDLPWRVSGDAVLLSLRLTPKSARDAVEGIETLSNGRSVLKARVRAVPEDGKANEALLRLLAKALDLPIRALSLSTGASGRTKVVRIEGSQETALARLSFLAGAL
jgi:uncharacterized protein (TIGR00251 family)